MSQVSNPHTFLDRGARLRGALARTPGLWLHEPHRGVFESKGHVADLLLRNSEHVRLTLPYPDAVQRGAALDAQARERALEAARDYPANLRVAHADAGLVWLLDAELDAEGRCTPDLEQLLSELLASTEEDPAPPATPDSEAVGHALRASSLGDGDVVRYDEGWELRPRVRGAARAVHAVLEHGGLRLHRGLGSELPESVSADRGELRRVLVEWALRANHHLRFARLTLERRKFVVEARVATEAITGPRLATTARAVAVAEQLLRPALDALLQDTRVARCYARLFLSTHPSSSSHEVSES